MCPIAEMADNAILEDCAVNLQLRHTDTLLDAGGQTTKGAERWRERRWWRRDSTKLGTPIHAFIRFSSTESKVINSRPYNAFEVFTSSP